MWKNRFGNDSSRLSGISLDSIPTADEIADMTSDQRRLLSEQIDDILTNKIANLEAKQVRTLKELWGAVLRAEMDSLTPEQREAAIDQAKALSTLPPEHRRAVKDLMTKKSVR